MRWRSRIVALSDEDPESLLAHPLNPRRHPGAQRDALRASLSELGWVAPVVVNDRTGYVVDGHARVEEALSNDERRIPVIHVELSEEEERLALAVVDPIAALATYDQERLDDLIATLDAPSALAEMLEELATEAKPLDEFAGEPESALLPLVLMFDRDQWEEVVAALRMVPGSTTTEKILHLIRRAFPYTATHDS